MAHVTKRVYAGSDGAKQLVDLDKERQDLMQRNQRILKELGLISTIESMSSSITAAVEAKKAAAPTRKKWSANRTVGGDLVLRRSLRTMGQQAELPPLLEPLFKRYWKEWGVLG